MKKYAMELVGTGLFVLSVTCIIASANIFAPIAIGITLMALIYMGAHVSGSHYNPAVTLGLLWNKKIKPGEAIGYITAQLLGAIIGYFVAHSGMGMNLHLSISPKLVAVFIAELIFTFALVTAVFHTAVSKSASGNSYFGFSIGGVVIAGASAVGGISGGFFNPAVLLGVGFFGGLSTMTLLTIGAAQIIASICASMFYSFTERTK